MHRLLIAFACLISVSVAIAATPKTPVSAANRIVIALRDGLTISGELIEATPAGVTLRPSPKSPPVLKPWSTIKQVGNGITRESILAEWRTSKKELLCDACDGAGAMTCPTCDGKGVDPTKAMPCDNCQGTGSTGPCRTSRCVDGKIPCPLACIKPSDFQGKPDADGKRWKSFPAKGGGFAKWSDGHVGQLVVYENGMPVNKGVCPKCGGKSVIDDPACHGSGKQPCVTCKGKGVVGPACSTCATTGEVPCTTCGGGGLKPIITPPVTVDGVTQ